MKCPRCNHPDTTTMLPCLDVQCPINLKHTRGEMILASIIFFALGALSGAFVACMYLVIP